MVPVGGEASGAAKRRRRRKMSRDPVLQNAGIFRAHLLAGIVLLLVTSGFSQNRAIPGNCQPSVSKWSLLNGIFVNGTLRVGELNLNFDCVPKLTKEAAYEY